MHLPIYLLAIKKGGYSISPPFINKELAPIILDTSSSQRAETFKRVQQTHLEDRAPSGWYVVRA